MWESGCVTSGAYNAAKGRKPRKPRAKNSSRKSTAEANKSADGKLRMKMRIVELESRMVVLERLVESINSPALQARADYELAMYAKENAEGEE